MIGCSTVSSKKKYLIPNYDYKSLQIIRNYFTYFLRYFRIPITLTMKAEFGAGETRENSNMGVYLK